MDYFEDLVNNPQNYPKELVKLYNEMGDECAASGLDYNGCRDYCKAFQKLGYPFDYGLDAEPYDLRPTICLKVGKSYKIRTPRLSTPIKIHVDYILDNPKYYNWDCKLIIYRYWSKRYKLWINECHNYWELAISNHWHCSKKAMK